MNRDSGKYKGKRMTGGGRSSIRTALFMPTLVAIKHNPVIREFYLRLLSAGKTKMTAVIAAMRKLLTIINIMVVKMNIGIKKSLDSQDSRYEKINPSLWKKPKSLQ